MPVVKFTNALNRFFPGLETVHCGATDLNFLLEELESKWPGLKSYLVDETGQLRQHVNIFVDGSLIQDKEHLTDPVKPDSEVYFFQALSGG